MAPHLKAAWRLQEGVVGIWTARAAFAPPAHLFPTFYRESVLRFPFAMGSPLAPKHK